MSIRERVQTSGRKVFDCCVDLGPDPETGKRRQERRTFRTKTEAKDHERAKHTEVRNKQAVARTRLTVGAYLTSWLTDVIGIRRERTTAAHYEQVITSRILPKFGHVLLADLTNPRIQRWIADMTRIPGPRGKIISERSIEDTFRILHSALASAVRQRILPHNPADGVSLPRSERGLAKETWTAEEAQRFLAVAQQDSYEPIWSLAIFTGLRRGELLGLRWSDIDFAAGTLQIRKTRTKAGSRPVTKGPKNLSSRRPVPIAPSLLALLTEHQARQALERAELGDLYQHNDLVCPNAWGQPWYPDTISHRFKSLVESAGVRPLNLHFTRHTFASLALARGESLAAVSEVLGHASRRITAEIYQHVDREQRSAVTSTVEAAIMSHFTADVTCCVTSNDDVLVGAEGVQEKNEVRPTGLEPVTSRSAMLRAPLPIPLNTKRRRSTKPDADSAIQEKNAVDHAG